MLRTRPLFFIFIFLCAAFSAKAQSESFYYRAALCEKESFYAKTPVEFNSAILSKASVLGKAGDFKSALSSLERVKYFALNHAQRDSIGIQKAYFAYKTGDYDKSFSYLEEVGKTPQYKEPRKKSEWAAMVLTFLVPAGFLYVGDPAGALAYMGANALSVGYIFLQISSACYFGGIVGGAMALNFSFMGAQEKVALLTQKRNSEISREAQRQALSSFFQASSEGRTERPE